MFLDPFAAPHTLIAGNTGSGKSVLMQNIILSITVPRCLDCVLETTKADVLAELAKREKAGVNPEPFLLRKSGQLFYNTSPFDLKKLMGDQDHIGENLRSYMQALSPAVRDIAITGRCRTNRHRRFSGPRKGQLRMAYTQRIRKQPPRES